MRTASAAALAVGLMLVADAATVEAREYPWCIVYRRDGRNCGFVSLEQCMETAGVNNGFCEQNFLYRPGVDPPVSPRARRPRG